MPFSADVSWERMKQLTAFPAHLEDYYKGILGEYEATFTAAEKAKAKGITKVVFDRGGYRYHGRVAALAEGARSGGLQF